MILSIIRASSWALRSESSAPTITCA